MREARISRSSRREEALIFIARISTRNGASSRRLLRNHLTDPRTTAIGRVPNGRGRLQGQAFRVTSYPGSIPALPWPLEYEAVER